MNRLMEFFRQAEDEQRVHLNWRRQAAPWLSLAIGIAFSALVGGVVGCISAAPSAKEVAFWVIVFSSGAVSGLVSFVVMNEITTRFLSKYAALTKTAQELEFFRRAGDKLGAFMFFVEGSNLDRALGWMSGTNSRSLNMVMAQVIQEQLDRAFQPTRVIIPIGSFSDHSNILARLLPNAENVCFTCIKSPRNWFIELDNDGVVHEDLPATLPQTRDINVTMLTPYSQERVRKYPSHYIRFLQSGHCSLQRRRVFLLNRGEWDNLVAPNNSEFFEKFMMPCERTGFVETRFVCVDRMEYMVGVRGDTNIRTRVQLAVKENVLASDYDIFEGRAMLVYIPAPPADANAKKEQPVLEFHVGGKVSVYADLVDLVFKELTDEYGIFTPEQVRAMISGKVAGPAPVQGVLPAGGVTALAETPPALRVPLSARAPLAAGAPPAAGTAPPDV